ncbi:glycosyltransferase family 2 protein [Enterovirga sp.]|uniref:glycosyltransferase family 2 protein n=1 Tax=Enterovirga sp. TaxID=2026350 RepID=UPI002C40A4A4|nr:glycosyltransferase family 2 protein [Enterovirga sp.]HMO31251.1 glycosyltransferase [Enterovirga sp.]
MTTSPASAGLPPDLRFLTRHGVPAEPLAEAARLARQWKVAPAEAALATGAVAPELFYRSLAAELGLPFAAPGFSVHALARYPQAILTGIAPLAEGGYVLAPRGEGVEDMLGRRASLVAGLSMTTPEALREAVFRARGETIARMAAEQLAREMPEHSYHAGLSWRQALVVLALLALVAAAGIATGRPAILALVLMSGFPFLALAAVKIAAVFDPAPVALPAGLPRTPDSDLPVYTILIPLHRERRVLAQIRAALLAFDYPHAKLDAKILVEAGDEETAAGLAEISWPGFVEIVRIPPGQPQTKPRALNVGLLLARGAYVVVYDAEDVPDPGQLREAASLFERLPPQVACLQARLSIDNTSDNLLTSLFTLEYGGLFDVVNPALAHFDLPLPLGGTSNHFRTEVLRTLGGWDPWNVTEDADLGIRLALAGHRVADLPSTTHEEAPARLRAWFAQRTRWMKGYVQVAITHSRAPARALRDLGTWRFTWASLLIGGAVISAAIYPVFTLVVLVQLASGGFFDHEDLLEAATAALSLVLLAAGFLAMILPSLAAIRRRGWRRLAPLAFLMPLYYLLVSLGTWRGILELVFDPDRWNKTEHGLARTSRSRGGAL